MSEASPHWQVERKTCIAAHSLIGWLLLSVTGSTSPYISRLVHFFKWWTENSPLPLKKQKQKNNNNNNKQQLISQLKLTPISSLPNWRAKRALGREVDGKVRIAAHARG